MAIIVVTNVATTMNPKNIMVSLMLSVLKSIPKNNERLPSAFSHLKDCQQRQAQARRMLHRSRSDAASQVNRQFPQALAPTPRHEERYVPRFSSSMRLSAGDDGLPESAPG